MNFFRNLFLFLCLAALVGAFLYAAKPDWFSGLKSSPKDEPPPMTERRTTMVLPVDGKQPTLPDGGDIKQLVEMSDEGLPSRVVPYIMVVDMENKKIRHYRLTANVKSVSLRSINPEVKVQQSRVLNSAGPYQIEFWIPTDRELLVDVVYQTAKR